MLLQYYVLHSATPVLLCTTLYYSSTTLYYTALLQYYSVLHSATPVLLCTTKYYSSTTLYYTVLLQYFSSTTLYYTVLHLIVNKPRKSLPIQWLARGNHDRASCFEKLPSFKLPTTKNPSFSHVLAQKTHAHHPICRRNLFHIVRTTSRHVPLRTWSQSATTYDGAVQPWGRSPQQHTTVPLMTQPATTYDNYISHSLRSLARMPQIRQVLQPSSYGKDVPRKRFYTG